jgi:hypothetical protein
MSTKPIVRSADRLGLLWSKGVRGSAMIVVPLILFSNFLGDYEWILVALAFVIVIFRGIGYMSASKHQACPTCCSGGEFVCGGKKVMFSCPVCQEIFETDCEILYSGAKPSKAP